MTATIVLQLVQEGKLALDDPISKYRPDVPNGQNITIAQLLNMRSGLPSYTEDPAFLRTIDQDKQRVWQPEELLKLAYTQPALFSPGNQLALLQHQLHPARPRHGAAHRQDRLRSCSKSGCSHPWGCRAR